MKTINEVSRPLVEFENMGIVMPDGTRLSARVWMPEDASANPVPAVLEYIPYRKRDGTLPRDELMHPYVAGHGYASVRVDMRGNGDSEGLMTDEYTVQELQDACDVIAWLAAQPWCSGAVGMMGKSWGGFNCLQTAFLQPAALKAVISVCSTTDRFADDIHFKGGCLLGENFGWGAVMLSFSSRPADPALRPDWRADWLARLEAEPWLAPRWASHQARDDYWRHGSICEDFARVQVPVLSIGGWADNYMNTVDALVRNVGAKGIVGPWVHQYPHTAVPGPAIGFLQEAVRWWDRWLKGVENGAETDPAMRAYMLHSAPPDASAPHRVGHWVAEAKWPSPNVEQRVLTLLPGRGGAALNEYLGQDETADFVRIVSTPQQLGLSAGEFFPMGLNAEMPGDQAADDALSLCFDGDVLEHPVSLLGSARLRLTVSSDQPLGFVVARLCDVGPDGGSVRIAHGMLNLCHRDSRETPQPMTPGRSEDVVFDLDQMAYRLAPGHRLRLALSNSYWPFVWPSPSQAVLMLSQGSLTLPVHEGGGVWAPPEPESAPAWAHRVLRAGQSRRYVETDMITGTQALCVLEDGGDVENLTHGLCSGETLTERWEIHPDDPLSAKATHVWEQRLSRGEWRVRTEARAVMTSDASHLHMQATLTAWEGEEMIFCRDFNEKVPRRFV
ncbi:MAG: CocE/NonD family hydrolase [Pseudotabrizicola sp.]|uniref:CocE/NonD family hydrolase n=1 Tax=Pseudotabrizicola sp. TaxID=2939647 RepID=UPI00272F1673|nr:CocE/NonD family hydrolase [Pseudotabrizicola sp.]MDP2080024.1 CocE/NonD family hydrolase [Pseudotabrizicola sp.]MDZ7575470.1 CocE/NonD family hydrolase [Pseudotabrizicola sp.]